MQDPQPWTESNGCDRARPVVFDEHMTNIALRIESDSPEAHTARLQLSGAAGRYAVRSGSRQIAAFDLTTGEDATIELPVEAGRSPVEFVISRVIELLMQPLTR